MSFRKDYFEHSEHVDYSNPEYGSGLDFTEKTSKNIQNLFFVHFQ